jgi:hypothetical protein
MKITRKQSVDNHVRYALRLAEAKRKSRSRHPELARYTEEAWDEWGQLRPGAFRYLRGAMVVGSDADK